MARGGIRDHLGGGFHRYSVDERWHVPHFEKMLYDQAQLAVAYLEGYQVSGDERYATVARGILDYVLRDMTDPAAASTPPRTPIARAARRLLPLEPGRDPGGARPSRRRAVFAALWSPGTRQRT